MGTRPMRSMQERLLAAQVAINGALEDDEVRAALAPFGYDEARLNGGRALYDAALALTEVQRIEYGQQFGASQVVEAAWQQADAAYTRTLKIARVAFKGDSTAAASLALNGRRMESLSGWLGQARTFYNNLRRSPDLIAGLAPFGYNAAKLEQEAALVAAVEQANEAQEQEKGEAQTATKQRDAALDDLDEWMADFKEVAEAALEENPQWLEKLGFGPIA